MLVQSNYSTSSLRYLGIAYAMRADLREGERTHRHLYGCLPGTAMGLRTQAETLMKTASAHK